MKHQPFYLPRSGKLVTQLPGGINFAYDLCLVRSRDSWKGPSKEYNVELEKKHQSQTNNAKKMSFRASKRPWKFRTRKTAKKC